MAKSLFWLILSIPILAIIDAVYQTYFIYLLPVIVLGSYFIWKKEQGR